MQIRSRLIALSVLAAIPIQVLDEKRGFLPIPDVFVESGESDRTVVEDV